MTLPTCSKTWQFQVNNVVTTTNGPLTYRQKMLVLIKNLLLGFTQRPWLVVRSCDSNTTASSDLWTGASKVVWANNGGVHSWIVLQQVGLGTSGTAQICIDCMGPYHCDWGGRLSVWVSPSAGFVTGGTTSARPTASDEYAAVTSDNFWLDGGDFGAAPVPHVLHVMQTTDGACTRIITTRGSDMDVLWMFETADNCVPTWTDRVWSSGQVDSTAIYQKGSLERFVATNYYLRARIAGATQSCCCAFEGSWSSTVVHSLQEFSRISCFDNGVHIQTPILCGSDAPARGRIGSPVDLWAGSNNRALTGQLPGGFPEVGPTQFAQFIHLIFPWDGVSIPKVA